MTYAKKIGRIFYLLPLMIAISFSQFGCIAQGTVESQLARYVEDDNEKEVSRWLFRREGAVLDSKELETLVGWAPANRWKFLKLVDHFEGTKRAHFLADFPGVLSRSPEKAEFVDAFKDSPSRTIQEILTLTAASEKAQN